MSGDPQQIKNPTRKQTIISETDDMAESIEVMEASSKKLPNPPLR
jgi:hypothetical protein